MIRLCASKLIRNTPPINEAINTFSHKGVRAQSTIQEDEIIDRLDHLVLTTADEASCCDFYTRVLGLRIEKFVGGTPPIERKAFRFGNQKINVHVKGREFEPKAHLPVPGARPCAMYHASCCMRQTT